MLIGFVLLVSTCGMDACEALPVTDDVYTTRHECMEVAARIHARRPDVILLCGEVYRQSDSDQSN
ncbi:MULTISPECIES: hypothetical protein [Yersinia]|jgi:hypothetical protein|uniref:Uncharacterized protein n=1 Tax=Yersinia intermedia TaxID=631 RepID=A0A0T9MNC1_YERIN|nr:MULTISPECIES: hypothetical protein [Yersinia]AJJ20125.1 hypothetical protein CH53_4293 [Yersinia intermedia]ARB84905.1 hypothetical protein A6J67_13410 [Yersinia sp. FDAARGOS_228]AVL34697.1 hypothetical protein CEQ36_03025 [Yersinia intermedia]MCB5296836.1 hypothetical protein [Yersinia intermedia]MCB5312826.1 hypothetical protein [Yersinia intermedia]